MSRGPEPARVDGVGAGPAQIAPSRLVFIGGLHRSGTTPLMRTLARSEEISGLHGTGVVEDEGQHLQGVYPAARTYGGPGRFALDPRSHLTEHSPLVTPAAASALLASWVPFWDLERRLLVEKSPPNLVMGRFLQELFPGSALVVVMRHPVVVALSTVKWRRLLSRHAENYTSVDTMVANWVRAYSTFLEDLPSLRRVVVVRYEDLVLDPEAALAPVSRLLELQGTIPVDGLRASHSEAYEQRWSDMGRTPWGRLQKSRLVSRHGDDIRRFGYDPSDLHALGPLPFDRS